MLFVCLFIVMWELYEKSDRFLNQFFVFFVFLHNNNNHQKKTKKKKKNQT